MSKATLEKLREAIERIDRPGSFSASGSVAAVLPGLAVSEIGPIAFPLMEEQAARLKELCEQAPYGKGKETIIDTSVRRVWRLTPDRFQLSNPEWDAFMATIVAAVREEFGLEHPQLEWHLYDLLLYEPGSFFLPHQDGEKLDRMVATLVVSLPSFHEGGELVVRHDGQERVLDLGSSQSNPIHIHYAAFYADCEHEVRPLRSGHRLCLIYNLTLARAKKPLTAPRSTEQVEAVRALLAEWSAAEETRRLVITLDHQYTETGLSWEVLKGADRAKADVISQAAELADCFAYLGLLTYWESGAGSEVGGDDGYGYRNRWDKEDDDDFDDDESSGEYEKEEVLDSGLSAAHCKDRAGEPMPFSELTVEESDLLYREALRAVTPDEEFEGYTGNAGMTLDRWYRHAALILWPRRRHFDIVCEQNVHSAVPLLEKMVAEWQAAGADRTASSKAACLDLARAALSAWSNLAHFGYHPESQVPSTLLASLLALEDAELVRRFFGEILTMDQAIDPGPSIADACDRYGWLTFQRELTACFQQATDSTIRRNARLLERLATARARDEVGRSKLCENLAQLLETALETFDQPKEPRDWQAERADRGPLLTAVARALVAANESDLLTRLVDYVLLQSTIYSFDRTLLAALLDLADWLKKQPPSAGLSRWVGACRGELEKRTAEMPRVPGDFQRPATVTCKCALCQELSRFLANLNEEVHRFRAVQEQRKHLEQKITANGCDLDCRTDKKGSPHTLVCTKNTNSYHAALKRYHLELKNLATVRAVESVHSTDTQPEKTVRKRNK